MYQEIIDRELKLHGIHVIKWSKGSCGRAWVALKEVKIPNATDPDRTGVAFHEIGHVLLNHRGKKPVYLQEYEAEIFALAKLKQYQIPHYQFEARAKSHVIMILAKAHCRKLNWNKVPNEILVWCGIPFKNWNGNSVFVSGWGAKIKDLSEIEIKITPAKGFMNLATGFQYEIYINYDDKNTPISDNIISMINNRGNANKVLIPIKNREAEFMQKYNEKQIDDMGVRDLIPIARELNIPYKGVAKHNLARQVKDKLFGDKEKKEVEDIVKGEGSTSEKIRALLDINKTRSEIASALDIRYQFVNNVMIRYEKAKSEKVKETEKVEA